MTSFAWIAGAGTTACGRDENVTAELTSVRVELRRKEAQVEELTGRMKQLVKEKKVLMRRCEDSDESKKQVVKLTQMLQKVFSKRGKEIDVEALLARECFCGLADKVDGLNRIVAELQRKLREQYKEKPCPSGESLRACFEFNDRLLLYVEHLFCTQDWTKIMKP